MKESRRLFLERIPARVIAAATISETILTSGCERVEPNVKRLRSDRTVVETGIQGAMLGGALSAFNKATTFLGIPTGNAGMIDLYNLVHSNRDGLSSHSKGLIFFNLAIFLFSSSVGPVVEEVAFRKWPSDKFLEDKRGIQWRIGIPTSFAFACLHNLSPFRLLEGKSPLILGRVPAESFIAGLFFWKKFREKGLLHSSIMHCADNFSTPFWSVLLKDFLTH